MPSRRTAFALVTLLVVCLVSALAAEGLLTLLNRPMPRRSGWRAPASERMRFQLNELGFRGHPIRYSDDEFVILLVGDSHVEAMACAYDWMPERRLEQHLRDLGSHVRVFSLGAAGYGQDQQLLALEEYFERYRADLVMVWQTPGNDIWNNVFPTADANGVQPKPTFRLEGSTLVGPTSRIGEVVSPRVRVLALWDRWFSSLDEEWERYLPAPYEPMREYSGPVCDTWQLMWDHEVGTIRTDNLRTEKSHEIIHLAPRSPRTQHGIDLTHRLLQEMSRVAAAHRAGFMTFWVDTPVHRRAFWLDAPSDCGDERVDEVVYALNGRYYRSSRRQKLANMADVNRGFDSFVARPALERYRVSPTDGHLNQHAVDALMKDVAAEVEGTVTGGRAGPAGR